MDGHMEAGLEHGSSPNCQVEPFDVAHEDLEDQALRTYLLSTELLWLTDTSPVLL